MSADLLALNGPDGYLLELVAFAVRMVIALLRWRWVDLRPLSRYVRALQVLLRWFGTAHLY